MLGELAAAYSGIEGEFEQGFAADACALRGDGEVEEGEAGALEDGGCVGGGEELRFGEFGLEFIVEEGELVGRE